MSEKIDLRSDTLTKPSEGMRKAMANAEVGDDVFGEDPTVNRLQERVAELFNREAALYVPSGTMGNQIGVNVHTRPGQEAIGDANCHIFNFERGMVAKFSGVTPRMIVTERGFLSVADVENALAPNDYHRAPTGLILVENTHNMKGGGVFPVEQLQAVTEFSHTKGIPVHMDGARVFNAATASGKGVAEVTRNVDSLMFCFSKGLGAPVGSMVVSSHDFIDEAKAVRKQLGGGMRQVGILAAACEYALDHNVKRLTEDHAHAQMLCDTLSELGLQTDPVETNIVIFSTAAADASEKVEQLEAKDVLCLALGPSKIRLVTNLNVNEEQIRQACAALKVVFAT